LTDLETNKLGTLLPDAPLRSCIENLFDIALLYNIMIWLSPARFAHTV
jgi:hypothetical protein